jgi:signal transduction histidine kinase
MTNCERHANANRIDISMAVEGGGVAVSIRDDGVGFDPARVRGRGLGLLGMQERIMELGGRLTISSQSGHGSVVSAQIPISQETLASEYSNSVGR